MNKIQDHPSHRENPFTMSDIVHYKEAQKETVYETKDVTVLETGEVYKLTVYDTKDKSGDFKEFRKIYVSSIDTFSKLSIPGLKMWCYVLSNLKISRDYIYIDIQDALEFCGYNSKSSIYSGIIDLLENELIARRTGIDGIYFINYDAFYNGSRLQNKPFDI